MVLVRCSGDLVSGLSIGLYSETKLFSGLTFQKARGFVHGGSGFEGDVSMRAGKRGRVIDQSSSGRPAQLQAGSLEETLPQPLQTRQGPQALHRYKRLAKQTNQQIVRSDAAGKSLKKATKSGFSGTRQHALLMLTMMALCAL